MSESEISQTHEGPVTEAGGDSPQAEPSAPPAPSAQQRPTARPQIGDTRPAPPVPAPAPAARVVPAVATLPKVAPTRPAAPVSRPGAFEDSDDTTEEEVGDDDEVRADGKRTRSRRRSGRD